MTTTILTRWGVGALTLLLVAVACSQAEEADKAKKVKVTLVVILASDKPGEVDERLQCIADEVRKRNQNLKSFKLESMTSESLTVNQPRSFPLVEGQTVQVAVRHGADKGDRVGVAVTPPGQGEIVYRTVCGKFLPILTRYQTRDKQRLILAVRVQPCNGGQ